MRLVIQFAIAAISSALFLMGAWAMFVESDTYLIGGDTSVERVANWTVDAPNPGWSTAAETVNLLDCANVLSAPNALAMRYVDELTRTKMAPTCLNLARAVTTNAPTAAYAWYVEARALSVMSRIPEMNDALRNSHLTSPNEQWIAELRVALAETHFGELRPEVVAGHQSDLAMLVLSGRGINSIARRYATDPGFRNRIVTIVETLPIEAQHTFVYHVRSALAKRQ